MAPLPSNLRRDLERNIIRAREIAERGSREAIEALTVHEGKRGSHVLSESDIALRSHLRAHARQIGDRRNSQSGTQAIDRLVQECAYEHWHRRIFARFLAENSLLVEPDSQVAVSLDDVEELARDEGIDRWELASQYAQKALPAIFRPDDPLLKVQLPREVRLQLDGLLDELPRETFLADDSLGWVYQFWQSSEKERVNKEGDKITGETLSAVTQLFTEHYMVLFLVHNTLGAWYAGKVLAERPELAASAKSEHELREAMRLTQAGGYNFEYLRFVRSSEPTALLVEPRSKKTLLSRWADFANGLQTSDYPRYVRSVWEYDSVLSPLEFFQSTVRETTLYSGRQNVIVWGTDGEKIAAEQQGAVLRGASAWGKRGVAVSAMNELKVTLYEGALYDDNTVVIIPKDESLLPAIWCLCSSQQYSGLVREMDQASKVRRALLEVPFMAKEWRQIAEIEFPAGLPEPESNDPTQWLFLSLSA